MFKLLSFVALFAVLAVVFASKAEDQESADFFFARYGYYPAGFSSRVAYTVGNVAAAYPAAYPYAPVAYPAATYPVGYRTVAGYYAAPGAAVVY